MGGQAWARDFADNCVMSAEGYGSKTCDVMRIGHGINILAKEDKSRNHRGFYPFKRTSGSFGLRIVWANRDERDEFQAWMEKYVRLISDPATSGVGPLRVVIPAREFDKIAVPSGSSPAAMYGDRFDAVTYALEMAFEGARDPLEYSSPWLSRYEAARVAAEGSDGSNTFYPAGNQEGGQPSFDVDLSDPGHPVVTALTFGPTPQFDSNGLLGLMQGQ